MSDKPNGVARPEDFKKAFEERAPATRLVLPKCGLPVFARRLSPLAVLMTGKKIEEAKALESEIERNSVLSALMLSTIQQVLVEPRLAVNPRADEIDPNWVPMEDGNFLFSWALGLIADDGTPLDEFFRDARGPAVANGAGGGDVRAAPKLADGPDGVIGHAV